MGGPGGHMWHPFDCPDVNSGQDLIDFFKNSINAIKRNPAALKIDGVNLSFRLKENPGTPTGYEFVVDRGSMKELDLQGVTVDNAHKRFVSEDGSPHGMVDATGILLPIFNDALPEIMEELQQLGMLEDVGAYGKYFNTEFVLKKINVKEYAFNFIALHGIKKFEPKGPSSRVGVNVQFDPQILDQIKEKVQVSANKRDFRVYTKIPTSFTKEVLFEDALNEQFTIVYKSFASDPEDVGELGAGEGSTKPIKVWLQDIRENPINKIVNVSDEMMTKFPKMNKKQTPYAKNIYLEILNGTSVADIAEGPEDIEAIVDGVVVMHATRLLGNALLDALESDEFGSAREQEGVVVKDENICGGTSFKFTGDFIIGGLATSFRETKYRTGELIKEFKIGEETQEEKKEFVILIPGGFKPPTGGHYHMIKYYDKNPDVRKVFVITGPKVREGVTLDQSRDIFSIYGGFSDKVEFKIAPWINPEDEEEERKSKGPVSVCYELMKDPNFVNQFPNLHFSIGASDKEDDDKRIKDFIKYFVEDNPGLTQAKISYYSPAKAFEVDGQPASASRMRKAFQEEDWETFKKLLPHASLYDNVVQILSQTVEHEGEDLQENFFTLGSLFSLVDEILLEEEKKTNCFDHSEYKTFDSKVACIKRTKSDVKNPEAYVASVVKDVKSENKIIAEQAEEAEGAEEGAIPGEALEAVKNLASWIAAKQGGLDVDAAKTIQINIEKLLANLVPKLISKPGAVETAEETASKEAEEIRKQMTEEAENLEEMSAVTTVGAMGYGAPLGGDDDEPKRKQA